MTRTKKSAALLKILVIAAILILLPIVTPNMYIMQIINMIGIYIIPVSYTHLDVYKRQPPCRVSGVQL